MMTRTRTTTAKPASKPAGAAAPETMDLVEDEECETQPTLGDLQNNILEFKNFISSKLDHIAADVSTINKRFDELKNSVDFNSAKITEIEKQKLPELEDSLQRKIQSLENKILALEIHGRKSNLLFYGLQQQEGENVYEVLKAAFVSLGIQNNAASSIAIANAHRLPRRDSGAEAARQVPVPIIARFCYMRDRNSILAAFEEQQRKRTKIPSEPSAEPNHAQHTQPRLTVRTDLPPAMKTRRWILANEAYKLRKEKGLSTRIFVKGINVHLQWKEKGTTKWNDHDV